MPSVTTNSKGEDGGDTTPRAATPRPTRALPTPPSAREQAAMKALRDLKISFISSASPGFEVLAGTYNQRVHVLPALIVFAKKAEHVRNIVAIGVTAGFKINARCGGHSYASLGNGGEDGHLVIDVSALKNVLVDPNSKVATVGAGARLGHVAAELHKQGGRAIAHGSCPAVGISGHLLHGGYGWIAHNRGLAVDWVVGANIVLASGVEVYCSKVVNPDLFWALRGAGSSFGIVTSYKVATFEAPKASTPFTVPLNWKTEAQKLDGVQVLAKFAQDCPARLNMRLCAHNSGGHSFEGSYYGSITELSTILEPLLKQTGGQLTAKTCNWVEGLEFYAEGNTLSVKEPYTEVGNFYATSLLLKDLTGDALKNFVHYWHTNGVSFRQGGWFFQLDIHGGKNSAIAAVKNSETAYVHRDKLFLVQLYHYFHNDYEYPREAVELLKGWVSTTTESIKDGDWGMYINYGDTELDREAANKLYFGENLPRLKQLKKRFDPSEVFYFPQSIAPAK